MSREQANGEMRALCAVCSIFHCTRTAFSFCNCNFPYSSNIEKRSLSENHPSDESAENLVGIFINKYS